MLHSAKYDPTCLVIGVVVGTGGMVGAIVFELIIVGELETKMDGAAVINDGDSVVVVVVGVCNAHPVLFQVDFELQ